MGKGGGGIIGPTRLGRTSRKIEKGFEKKFWESKGGKRDIHHIPTDCRFVYKKIWVLAPYVYYVYRRGKGALLINQKLST